ncbi:MAG: helix-turn-helix domain-containing protein [Gammaproteobacteria bacterium]|nr:helix-turn-helix domain-containing protein [Gammaproteobacteria bacterium]
MLNEAFGRWEPGTPDKPDFFGAVKCYDDTILKIIDCTCDPCAATRNRASIMADDRETLTIQAVLQGREYVDFNGEEIALRPGDLLIWDSTKPMSFRVQERLHKISVVLPLHRFRSWLPRSWFSIRHSIDGHSNTGFLLANHIEALSTTVFDGGCKDDYALIDATMGVLVNALDMGNVEDPTPIRVTQLCHIKQYIIANIRDPSLSPTMIAKAGGMSSRYLHWLFHSANDTVKQFVFRQRLDFCVRDLLNPRMRHRKISDIALSWGFQDATHFSKRFKQQYAMSPREFREKMRSQKS